MGKKSQSLAHAKGSRWLLGGSAHVSKSRAIAASSRKLSSAARASAGVHTLFMTRTVRVSGAHRARQLSRCGAAGGAPAPAPAPDPDASGVMPPAPRVTEAVAPRPLASDGLSNESDENSRRLGASSRRSPLVSPKSNPDTSVDNIRKGVVLSTHRTQNTASGHETASRDKHEDSSSKKQGRRRKKKKKRLLSCALV